MSTNNEPPQTFKELMRRFPAITDAHEALSQATLASGPLDPQTCALIKLGISVGAGLDSAVRSHVRRAKAAGASQEAIEQAILLGMTTIGFPQTVRAWSQAQVQFERDANGGQAGDKPRQP